VSFAGRDARSPEPGAAEEPAGLVCEACGAKLVVAPTQRTVRCPYCDLPSVIDRPATSDRPDPVFVIGFSVDRPQARARLRDHLRGHRWAPHALRTAAAERVDGIYVPAYLYSATGASRYHAEIGENYTVNEFDAKRKSWRRVTRTEYRSLEGHHRCQVDDTLVTASQGVPNRELEAIEPFDLGGLRRFSPAMVAGWAAEEPSTTRQASMELAREEARTELGRRLHRFMPGDSHHSLSFSAALEHEAMDLVALPVWVCSVRWREDRDPVRLLVNGQTGRVAGDVPVSWAKVAAVVCAGLALVGLAILIGTLL